MLVDINGLDGELGYIRRDNGKLRVGALTRHYQIRTPTRCSRALPLLAEMAAEVGDEQVRTMGTIGGVLAHGDPAGDYGTLALMLDATIKHQQAQHCRARLFHRAVHDAAGTRRDPGRGQLPRRRAGRTTT